MSDGLIIFFTCMAFGMLSVFIKTFNPKKGSFWWRIIHVLNWVSWANPRDVRVMPVTEFDELMALKEEKENESKTN